MTTIAMQPQVVDVSQFPELNATLHRKSLRRGETLFLQGDTKKYFFAIHRGMVKLTRSSGTGRDVITEILFPGDVCGSLCALDCHPYPVTAVCLQDTEVTVIPRETFNLLVERHPELMTQSVQCCRAKMRFQREMMVGMAVERADQRAARALLMLAQRLGQQSEGGIAMRMPLTRQEFSEFVGTTVETAIRILSRFRKQGLIEERGEWMVLRDEAVLTRMAAA